MSASSACVSAPRSSASASRSTAMAGTVPAGVSGSHPVLGGDGAPMPSPGEVNRPRRPPRGAEREVGRLLDRARDDDVAVTGQRGGQRVELGEREVLPDATACPEPERDHLPCEAGAVGVAGRVEPRRIRPDGGIAVHAADVDGHDPGAADADRAVGGVQLDPSRRRRADQTPGRRVQAQALGHEVVHGLRAVPERRPELRRAGGVHQHPRQRGRRRLVPRQQEPEDVTAQLATRQRTSADASRR